MNKKYFFIQTITTQRISFKILSLKNIFLFYNAVVYILV